MDLFGKKKIAALDKELQTIKETLTEKTISPTFDLKGLQTSLTNWNVASYSSWNTRREIETYVEIDDIYSIISLLATTAATIPMYGYTVTNDDALKRYQRESGIQKKYYQTKSMQDLPEGDPVYKLLEKPNEARFEFMESLYTLLFINGEVFLWKERIKFGPKAGVTRMHILHPADMIVFVSITFPQVITSYRYVTPYGEIIDFDVDEIIQIKYCNPRNLYQQQFRGMSPITSLRKRLARIEGSMNVSVSQMQNGGVPGIVYDKVNAGTKEAKEVGDMRKVAFASYLNNTANKGAPYFSSGELGYLALGLPLVDMNLVELNKEDFAKLCNAYHISNILLNNDASSTESNVKVQTKRMYTNSILPNVYRVRDAFINNLLPDFPGVKRYIEADISDVTELQEDMQTQSQALKLMEWITPNEKRKIQRFDDSDEPMMDDIIISSGQMLLADLGGVADPNNTDLNNTNDTSGNNNQGNG
jgi:HK97 family phage portal protein